MPSAKDTARLGGYHQCQGDKGRSDGCRKSKVESAPMEKCSDLQLPAKSKRNDLRLVGLQTPKHFEVIVILDEGFCFGHGGWVQVVNLCHFNFGNWRLHEEGEERD
jgi:hypothetical protein